MNRFILALGLWLAAFSLVPGEAISQAPLELQHGEQITVSCAPAPPACSASCGDSACDPGEDACSCSQDCGAPPAAENQCSDGVDNDCDGLVDCADTDCSADPACPPPPPTAGSPPQPGLEAHWSWDSVHAVECGVMPPAQVGTLGGQPPAGSCIHHLLDSSSAGREATETEADWWPDAQADGIMFSGDDQLLFQNCTGCNPGPCVCTPMPWSAGASDPWAFVFAGYVHTPGKILGYAEPAIAPSYISSSHSGAWQVRINGTSKTTFGVVPLSTRVAVLVERRLDSSLVITQHTPCAGWADSSIGAVAPFGTPEFGCLSCYQVNDGGVTAPGTIFLREAMLYRHAFDSSERADLFAYLDAEHGAWVDEGCSP